MAIPYVPPPAVVEIVEHNHVYDDDGRLIWSQVIFWDWEPRDSQYHARDFVFTDREPRASVSPDGRGGAMVWVPSNHDEYGGGVQMIRGRVYRETWTQTDREAADRFAFPEWRERRGRVVRRWRHVPVPGGEHGGR